MDPPYRGVMRSTLKVASTPASAHTLVETLRTPIPAN